MVMCMLDQRRIHVEQGNATESALKELYRRRHDG
jgi:hypothetical protein